MKTVSCTIMGEELLLFPSKALYWPRHRMLMLADVHLGKVTHFRRAGIAVPTALQFTDLQRLDALIDLCQPEQVAFLGDLFHSYHNAEWPAFGEFLRNYPEIQFTLVRGNHDILEEEHYRELPLALRDQWTLPPFLLTHEPLTAIPSQQYNLCGHLHPGVILGGPAKQRLRLPCFYFGPQQGILPAFGRFTGLAILQPKAGERYFVITEEEVLEV
ncbi:MAG: ligase-associated DNA damage response endonuclease PdeM [Bacteroidota bacterium]